MIEIAIGRVVPLLAAAVGGDGPKVRNSARVCLSRWCCSMGRSCFELVDPNVYHALYSAKE